MNSKPLIYLNTSATMSSSISFLHFLVGPNLTVFARNQCVSEGARHRRRTSDAPQMQVPSGTNRTLLETLNIRVPDTAYISALFVPTWYSRNPQPEGERRHTSIHLWMPKMFMATVTSRGPLSQKRQSCTNISSEIQRWRGAQMASSTAVALRNPPNTSKAAGRC